MVVMDDVTKSKALDEDPIGINTLSFRSLGCVLLKGKGKQVEVFTPTTTTSSSQKNRKKNFLIDQCLGLVPVLAEIKRIIEVSRDNEHCRRHSTRVVVRGDSGTGKSTTAAGVKQWCEDNDINYIAIKPTGTAGCKGGVFSVFRPVLLLLLGLDVSVSIPKQRSYITSVLAGVDSDAERIARQWYPLLERALGLEFSINGSSVGLCSRNISSVVPQEVQVDTSIGNRNEQLAALFVLLLMEYSKRTNNIIKSKEAVHRSSSSSKQLRYRTTPRETATATQFGRRCSWSGGVRLSMSQRASVVCVEDVHLINPAVVNMLHMVCTHMLASKYSDHVWAPVCVVFTCNTTAELPSQLVGSDQLYQVHEFQLSNLSQQDILELMTLRAPNIAGVRLAGIIHEATRGNPMLCTCVIDQLQALHRQQGNVYVDKLIGSVWEVMQMGSEDVAAIIVHRLDMELDQNAQIVMKHASVIGVTLTTETLLKIVPYDIRDSVHVSVLHDDVEVLILIVVLFSSFWMNLLKSNSFNGTDTRRYLL